LRGAFCTPDPLIFQQTAFQILKNTGEQPSNSSLSSFENMVVLVTIAALFISRLDRVSHRPFAWSSNSDPVGRIASRVRTLKDADGNPLYGELDTAERVFRQLMDATASGFNRETHEWVLP
jgi:hypothetical protein